MTLLANTIAEITPTANPALENEVRRKLLAQARPPGSLGMLDELCVRIALIRATSELRVNRKVLFVCIADHGISAEGVSAFPKEFTATFMRVLLDGGTAINAFCREHAFDLVPVDMGIDAPAEPGAVCRKVAFGTKNFALEPAMSRSEAVQAIEAGIALAQDSKWQADLVAAGEMGIGNTTSAAAVFAAFSGLPGAETVGAGSGVGQEGIARKGAVVDNAISKHPFSQDDPISILANFGGFEIGAMAGIILGGAARRVPVLIDGFVCSSAALVARSLCPSALDYAIFSHLSAERSHLAMLKFLGAEPLLSLGLRLGEGTGSVLAATIIETAVRTYNEVYSSDQVKGLFTGETR